MKHLKYLPVFCALLLGTVAVPLPSQPSSAQLMPKTEGGMLPTASDSGASVLLQVDAKFDQAAYVVVNFEAARSSSAGSGTFDINRTVVSNAVMTVKSLPGETAVMTCSIQSEQQEGSRDCNGSTQSAAHVFTGQQSFGGDSDLGEGLLGGLNSSSNNDVQIDVSYI